MKHKHQWGEWIAYDSMAIEFGITDGFQYRRKCMVSGCEAEHRTEKLVPVGKSEFRFEDDEDREVRLAMRKIQDSDLVGKTIQSIQNDSVNVVRLTFTDGSTVELWAEQAIRTLFGDIPGIFVEDSVDPDKT